MRILRQVAIFVSVFFCTAMVWGQNIYRDNFSSASYSRNDGNSNFSSNWIESNDDNSASDGYIRITGGRLRFNHFYTTVEVMRRSVDLSGASSATLSFDWETVKLDSNEELAVQISTNGSPFIYTTLQTFGGSKSGLYSVDISAYISSSTTISFTAVGEDWESDEYAYIDNFEIATLSVPPTITASGDQVYCPGVATPIVQTVSITDPNNRPIDKVFVQVSSNYNNGKDQLVLTGTHPNITATWSASEGKLTLKGPATSAQFEAALLGVRFNTSATVASGDTRNFSIVLSEANYLVSTGHYYEYVPALGITWTAARDAAAAKKFYGLKGYLATLTTAEEAEFVGKQSRERAGSGPVIPEQKANGVG